MTMNLKPISLNDDCKWNYSRGNEGRDAREVLQRHEEQDEEPDEEQDEAQTVKILYKQYKSPEKVTTPLIGSRQPVSNNIPLLFIV